MTANAIAPMVVRGEVITSDLIEFGGRGGELQFSAPDPHKFVDRLPLASPSRLIDLYQLSLDEILDYLEELGKHLDVQKNTYLQEARELSYLTAPTTPPIVDTFYAGLPDLFKRERVQEIIDLALGGSRYLEGWVEHPVATGTIRIRAYGSRAVHIVAGNGPTLGAMTLIRNAISRSDAIIKAPSNDPFTTIAIARTMCDFAPDHPVTKHFSVAYWRGGDEVFEQRLYKPHNVEKIVAWGGYASVKHVTRYIQPGLELISLDPKRSVAVIGAEALSDDEALKDAGERIAIEMGSLNQIACSSIRIAYILCGTDKTGVEKVNRLGEYVYQALLSLPEEISTKPKAYDRQLASHVNALRITDDWFKVIGGSDGEGAVIVSQLPEAVDFYEMLADRTVNLIPVDSLNDVLQHVDAYTQTVAVYPEELVDSIQDELVLCGAQRFVTAGHGFTGPGLVGPQDGIEPLRRMCKWIIREIPANRFD